MTERRYTEEEVAAIFDRATESQRTSGVPAASGVGPTLADLQEIGREVGLSPELVARAARSIDRVGEPSTRRFFGLPLSVGRTVELDRPLSEAEWERLVSDLRETFDAVGAIRYDGPFREWSNGNLRALVEPTPEGHRIRLRTLRGQSRALMTAGSGLLGIATTAWLVTALSGGGLDPDSLASFGLLATLGAAIFGLGALRLPGWARTRRRQMEEIATRLALEVSAPVPDRPPTEHGAAASDAPPEGSGF